MKTMIYPTHQKGELTPKEQEFLTAVGEGISAAELSHSLVSSRNALYGQLVALKEKGFIKTESVYLFETANV